MLPAINAAGLAGIAGLLGAVGTGIYRAGRLENSIREAITAEREMRGVLIDGLRREITDMRADLRALTIAVRARKNSGAWGGE